MRLPLVVPKRLVALIIAQPISLHVVQRRRRACGFQDLRDVRVGAGGVAVFGVRAVAVVGPEAVDRPGIGGAGHWVGVPELHLLEEPTGGFVAARVCWNWAGIAGELRGGAGFGLVGGGRGQGGLNKI